MVENPLFFVSLVSDLTPHKLSFPNVMLTVLGTVLGLVISFRTSPAYERYMDGSKLWTTIIVCSHNLAHIIWIHVPSERTDSDTETKHPKSELEITIEKKSMINLVQAVSVAIKHLLRGEPGVHHEDLYPLVSFLPCYSANVSKDAIEDNILPIPTVTSKNRDHILRLQHRTSPPPSPINRDPERDRGPRNAFDGLSEDHINRSLPGPRTSETAQEKERNFDPEMALPIMYNEHHPLQPASNPSKCILGSLRFWRSQARGSTPKLPTSTPSRSVYTDKRIKKPVAVDSNVPLEITLFLSNYLAWLLKHNQIQPTVASAFIAALSTLQDTVTNLDRIRNTPLPFAYQLHLRMSLWLYLFFLPFQVWSTFGYLTIPGTAFVSFLMLGFLQIGHEIENPFDYDLNDLDLGAFCFTVQREANDIMAHSCPDLDRFVFASPETSSPSRLAIV
ncbi:hypothetical protein V8D89_006282 [Ganoderma adspersum]